MRKIALALLILILGIGAPIWAAGTCAVSDVTSTQIAAESNRIADASTVIVTLTCTGDASTGSFPSTAVPLTGSYPTSSLNTYNLTGYLLYAVGRTPGATQPTANYSVAITDAQGFAIDLGLLTSNGSASAAQMTAVTNSSSGSPVIRSPLTVAITGNSVNSAQITLDLIFRLLPLAAASSSGSSIVASIAGTASPPTSATTLYAVPSTGAGMYRICSVVIITTAGAGGSVTTDINYTGKGHAFSNVPTFAASVSVTTQWNTSGLNCDTFWADASTNIQAWLALGGVSGSPAYWYDVKLEYLGN